MTFISFTESLSCSENGLKILAISATLAILTCLILVIFILKLIKRNNYLEQHLTLNYEKVNKLETELNNCILKGRLNLGVCTGTFGSKNYSNNSVKPMTRCSLMNSRSEHNIFNTIDPEKCKFLLNKENLDESMRYSLNTKTIHRTMMPVSVSDVKPSNAAHENSEPTEQRYLLPNVSQPIEISIPEKQMISDAYSPMKTVSTHENSSLMRAPFSQDLFTSQKTMTSIVSEVPQNSNRLINDFHSYKNIGSTLNRPVPNKSNVDLNNVSYVEDPTENQPMISPPYHIKPKLKPKTPSRSALTKSQILASNSNLNQNVEGPKENEDARYDSVPDESSRKKLGSRRSQLKLNESNENQVLDHNENSIVYTAIRDPSLIRPSQNQPSYSSTTYRVQNKKKNFWSR